MARGWWIVGQLCSGPHWPRHQFTAAIGANTVELLGRASHTEGALKATDARVWTARRKIAVTTFAIGAQFQHAYPSKAAAHPSTELGTSTITARNTPAMHSRTAPLDRGFLPRWSKARTRNLGQQARSLSANKSKLADRWGAKKTIHPRTHWSSEKIVRSTAPPASQSKSG
jgi:hypothetical protein